MSALRALTLPLFTTALALLAFLSPAQAQSQGFGDDSDLCRVQTVAQGHYAQLPANLLTALSHVESGRWDAARGEKVAWPWTVMAEGRGRYFPTKEGALAEVRALQARGVRNIDVGCMQINLHYHGEAFDTLEQAFDPAINVAYAVRFLQSLYRETGSWTAAATRYHSATPEYATRYYAKLVEEWNALNGTPTLAVRLPTPATAGQPSPSQLAALAEQERQRAEALAETERQRAEARRFAEDWRSQRLAEYQRARAERLGGEPG